jgi:hypothetical protein
MFVILNLSTKFVQADTEQKKEMIKIANEFIPPNSLLVSPEHPYFTQSIQEYDFNHDKQKELIITFEVKGKEQPSPSQFGAMVLKREKEDWKNVWETKGQGVGLGFSGLADITGDGTKEYLFARTIGAAAGSELGIFKWDNNSLRKIANVPYHRIDLLNGNQKVGIAVWQWFIADSYFVNVLKWNGEKLVVDEELYSKYYPVIEKFYKNKISKMDAWFYWYCLADAQIKANLYDEASKSIQKGIVLAKKLSMPDVVQEFYKISEKIENRKK